ncbi:MAG TPA: diguanylate cyclase [Thermotogota bacterium]|nr:diguanylate cyclase [Thermotogota bacterium]HRW93394.1 diguanylate cyclase [Thermotogota bacterium]
MNENAKRTFHPIVRTHKKRNAQVDFQNRLRSLMQAIPDTIYFKDLQGRFLLINRAQAQVLGLSQEKLALGKTDFDFFDSEHAASAREDEKQVFSTGQALVNKLERIRLADGSYRWVTASKVPTRDANGNITGLVGISRDVSLLKQTQDALHKSQQRFRAIFEHAPVMILSFQPDGSLELVNRCFQNQVGFGPGQIPSWKEFQQLLFSSPVEFSGVFHEFEVLTKSGESRFQMWAFFHLPDDSIIAMGYDISGKKKAQVFMEFQALHDPLTNLPNRRNFFLHLQKALAAAREQHHRVAVFFIDLDHFKQINDQYGHETGDLVLVEIAQRLQSTLRENDMVSRLGGDEFTLFLSGLKDMHMIPQVAQRLLSGIRKPIQCPKVCLRLSGSIGIALFPDHGETAQTLVQKADEAMYFVKQSGRGNFSFCRPNSPSHPTLQPFIPKKEEDRL